MSSPTCSNACGAAALARRFRPARMCRAFQSNRRAMRAMAIWRPMSPWCWQKTSAGIRWSLPTTIAEKLRADATVADVGVARPGLSILRLSRQVWIEELAPGGRGWSGLSATATSARPSRSMSNMSRPIQPVRCMSAIAAARCLATRSPALLAFTGFNVTREYYINDAGTQVDQARALRLSALPRSARRGHRRHSGRDFIRATISNRSARRLRPNMATR